MDGEGDFTIRLYAHKDRMKRLRRYGLKAYVRISQARRSLLDAIGAFRLFTSASGAGRTGRVARR